MVKSIIAYFTKRRGLDEILGTFDAVSHELAEFVTETRKEIGEVHREIETLEVVADDLEESIIRAERVRNKVAFLTA